MKSYTKHVRWMGGCLLWVGWSVVASAGMITADNVTVQAGTLTQINVKWTSTQTLNFLVTGFRLDKISGSDAAVSYVVDGSGSPALPPLLDTNYLFYGDSFAATLLPQNPASVSQTFYANDTYIMSDTTESGANRLQDGTRVWTVLNIVAAPGVSGVYKLVFQSSEYDFDGSSGAIGLTAADLSGGIITIENSTVIPEPATFSMGLAGLVGLVWRARQKGK